MKGEIYATVAVLNRGLEFALESLTSLQERGLLTPEYVSRHCVSIEEMRAGINHMIADKMESREAEDWYQFGRLKIAAEDRLKAEEPDPSSPPSQPEPPTALA